MNVTSPIYFRRDSPRAATNRHAATNPGRARAIAAYARLTPIILRMAATGLTLEQIADDLDTAGNRTRRGAAFRDATVWRILSRVGAHAGVRRR